MKCPFWCFNPAEKHQRLDDGPAFDDPSSPNETVLLMSETRGKPVPALILAVERTWTTGIPKGLMLFDRKLNMENLNEDLNLTQSNDRWVRLALQKI